MVYAIYHISAGEKSMERMWNEVTTDIYREKILNEQKRTFQHHKEQNDSQMRMCALRIEYIERIEQSGTKAVQTTAAAWWWS